MGTLLAKPIKKPISKRVIPRRNKRRTPLAKRVGIVLYFLQGPSSKAGSANYTPSKLIESLKEGLPVQELSDLTLGFDLPMEKLSKMLGISKATLHRRKATGRLDTAESDRVVRFARLLGMASSVMESPENGRRWLSSQQFGLGGAIPLSYAETEVGTREVEDLLGRIEYGVFS